MNLWRVWVVGVALAIGCTKPNPAATCADGTCIDPNFPICDVDGSLTGDPGTCVSMGCTGGEFKSCSDTNTALVCASDGSKFEPTTCALGCDPTMGCNTCTAGTFQSCQDASTALTCDASGGDVMPTTCPNGCDMTLGCRACMPSQTTCANGITETCDAAGNISGHETCALGCSSDATRCGTLDPSNNLGMFYDMTADPQDLTLSGTLDLKDGKLTSGTTTATIPSFTVTAPTGGAPIRVFVGKHVALGDLSVVDTTVSENPGGIGFAIAVLATQDLDVMGTVTVTSGAVNIAGCTGSSRTSGGSTTLFLLGGAGGGGHASAGAAGGDVPMQLAGAAGGSASGTDTLVPLRGGCPGGSSAGQVGEHGGGAIQLVSETAISVTGTIIVDATSSPFVPALGGGGGGGGVLLEAPAVTLDPSAKLLARGGGGVDGDLTQIPTPLEDASAPPGAVCPVNFQTCGDGGAGAAPLLPATRGGNTPAAPPGTTGNYFAGCGGGGIGRIRINTSDATFVTSSSVATAAALTAGVVGTK